MKKVRPRRRISPRPPPQKRPWGSRKGPPRRRKPSVARGIQKVAHALRWLSPGFAAARAFSRIRPRRKLHPKGLRPPSRRRLR